MRLLFRKKRSKGQAMVELALSLPLLLAVLAAIIELSMLISHASTLQEAVNQACRFGAENKCTIEDVKARVEKYLENDKLLQKEDLDVDVEESVDFNGSPTLTIHATLKMRPFSFTHFGTFTATSSATYRKEWGGPMP